VYLALGDSWAYGQGATDPETGGYVPQLESALQEEIDCHDTVGFHWGSQNCKHLELVNLGRPATDTLPGVTAPIVADEQLPVALPMLEHRNGDQDRNNNVEVVTLHVGGNDVFEPIQLACLGGITDECLTTFLVEMATYQADLDNVVSQLRAAAGPDTTIVLGTYDNPVPYCYLGGIEGAELLGDMVLEGTEDGALDGLHDVVRSVAAAYDAEVAEVFGQLGADDFVGGQDCLHPTDSGHDKVTAAFLSVLTE